MGSPQRPGHTSTVASARASGPRGSKRPATSRSQTAGAERTSDQRPRSSVAWPAPPGKACPSSPACVSSLRAHRVVSRLAPQCRGGRGRAAASYAGCSRDHRRESHAEACCADILQAPSPRSPCRGGGDPEENLGEAQGHPQPSLWEGKEGAGWSGGHPWCCVVIPNNCGLILQVCIRKYKARQFVGSSNFQSPESSKNYFGYPR